MFPAKAYRIPKNLPLLGDTGFGYCMNGIIIGISGWIMETCIYYLEVGRLYDCGFLLMPWCPIYAVGIFFAYSIVHLFPKKLTFFPLALICAVSTTALEAVSGIVFHMFDLTLWDYSYWPLSNRYISLPASIAWGILGACYILYILPLISKKAATVPVTARKYILGSFSLWVVLDYIVTFSIILANGKYSPLY